MAEPYLDRGKLIQFLGTHPPVGQGPLSLTLGTMVSPQITREYSVVLRAEKPTGVLLCDLEELIEIVRLFPGDAHAFTVLEMADFSDQGALESRYERRVKAQLKLLQLCLTWNASHPSSLAIGKVKQRDDLDRLQCYISVQASMPNRLPSVLYTSKPYFSLTDDLIALDSFLDKKTLDQAWQECWVGGVRFREFL